MLTLLVCALLSDCRAQLTVALNREGTLENMEVKGVLTLTVNDAAVSK